ncbi:carboxypeptidase B-like isoform X1 [Aphidius gifuensis]|uniref:carboxypeptidase B-like isoform X1 n=1 Tax=Aphidius gifuensis TaxID=684658 RepID=UPI001CDC436E|nr:carboxypeptidase B-like isoform X1 [Aphidius gifuensis]
MNSDVRLDIKYKKPDKKKINLVRIMYRFCLLFIAFLATPSFSNEQNLRPLKGMQRLLITCQTLEELSFVKTYIDNDNFDILKLTRRLSEPIDVLVIADQVEIFRKILDMKEIQYSVDDYDVAVTVHDEAMLNNFQKLTRRSANFTNERTPFGYYPRYQEIETYLHELSEKYRNIVTVFSIGNSFEGRPIYVVKIASGGSNKPAVFIDAGIHAREWIAPSTALHAIHELATNKNNSYLYENVDWYIVPCLNPDGYEYTHTDYRFWRKTRSNSGSRCPGTDANRNFDYKWMTIGASSSPCEDTYAGPKPFSEPETQALRDFLLANKQAIKVYLTLHSYGNWLLHPWGWTDKLPENEPILRKVGLDAAEALSSKYGTRYTVGSSTVLLYAAAGGSDDWAMAVAGIELSYTIELPGGRFDPLPNNIAKVGHETFEAFVVFQTYVENKYIN